MATGRERRAEKLNQRLRGAQRANVDDDSFSLDISGLDIPGLDIPPPPEPTTVRRTPNTSAKRRRLDNEAPTTIPQVQESATRRSPRSVAKHPYDLPDTSEDSILQTAVSIINTQRRSPRTSPRASVARFSKSKSKSPAVVPRIEPEADELESLPDPKTFRSPAPRRISNAPIEEVTESPAHAPGSGRRRIIASGGLPTSARLRKAASVEASIPPSSSPLARKLRRSDVAASVRSTRSVRASSQRLVEMTELDELSPDRPVNERPADEEAEFSETHPMEEIEEMVDAEATDEEPIAAVDEPQLPEFPELDEAEEIGEVEAAKVLGRKRPRQSLRSGSPELGNTEAEEEESLAKRRRPGRPVQSPVKQRQSVPKPKPATKPSEPKPKSKPAATKPPTPKEKAKPAKKSKAAAKSRRESLEKDGPSIDITVQRFVNVKELVGNEAEEGDPLQSEMPFANRAETVVDVLAQVCQEVIESVMMQFQDKMRSAEDRARKKEFRIQMRAVEAYREELNSRLLQHAIHLNDWQTLRKRVRHVQKEKLALREEILKVKAEREQIALRMDAVRAQHEEDTKESTYRSNTSAIMHNIDIAVEQGRDAPDLTPAQQKQAELANLELLVSQITEEASSASATGGILDQVRSFNTFLERTALALESR